MKLEGYDFLESLLMFGIRPGLDTTSKFCNKLGFSENDFNTIHVVGTNGKGSTSFFLSHILQAHGKKTGLFTSPHLISLRERIRIENQPISEKDLNRALLEVKRIAETENLEPTYFETLTIAALIICKEKKIDVLVAEAGLGGRFDATAIAKGNTTILTSIGLEHTAILGDSLEAILREKLCIMKKGSRLAHFPIPQELKEEFESLKKELQFEEIPMYPNKVPKLSNLGKHYTENALLALSVAKDFLKEDFSIELANKALKKAFWPGRMQCLYDKNGNLQFILDGAHNSHAMKRLAETLKQEFPGQKFTTLLGVLQDKDLKEMLELIKDFVAKYYPTRTSYERFRDPVEMETEIHQLGYLAESGATISRSFIEEILQKNTPPILITGSLYLIGACIEILKQDFKELEFFRCMTPESNEKH